MKIGSSFLFLFLLFSPYFTRAQTPKRNCGFQLAYEKLLSNDQFVSEQSRLNGLSKTTKYSKADTVIIIPVVVHVVYKNEQENISDAQIYSQLEVLNADFRKLNADTGIVKPQFSKADVKLEFCLAHTDPNGNFTTGITRTFTTEDNIGIRDRFHVIRPTWGNADYLNIWVCDFGSNVAGQGFPPGSPANLDGLVIDYTNFGTMGTVIAPYDKGRTASHEVGHWLNLYHLWGINDNNPNCSPGDLVSDTPEQNQIYYNCPGNRFSCADLSMHSNFMSYVDDRCMANFTAGQKVRMRNALINSRSSLLNSNKGCLSIGLAERNSSETYSIFPNPSSGTVHLATSGINQAAKFVWYNSQGKKLDIKMEGTSNSMRFELGNFPSGIYFLKVINPNGIHLKKVILNN